MLLFLLAKTPSSQIEPFRPTTQHGNIVVSDLFCGAVAALCYSDILLKLFRFDCIKVLECLQG